MFLSSSTSAVISRPPWTRVLVPARSVAAKIACDSEHHSSIFDSNKVGTIGRRRKRRTGPEHSLESEFSRASLIS